MPLFSRSLKPEGDEGVPAATDDTGAESVPRHTIGELLRETRQSYGGEIDRIAATLRIRAAYLTAIEESQYDKLPGPVYAQGFVRAYAVHLGLDGDEAIRRFKQEVAGFEVTRDLSFPVPLAERSIPGGTVLLAALILAICGYGLWYYVSTGDRAHPERVSTVPPDLVAASQTPPPTPAVSPNPAPPAPALPTAASPAPAAPSLPAASAAPAPTPAAATAVASATPSPGTSASPSATASTTSAPPAAPATSPPLASAVASAPPPSSPPVAAPATPAVQEAATPPAATPPPPASVAPPPTADAAVTPAPTNQPHVYGAPADVPARIIVHAIKDSWIQLRNGDEILIERILHPGDTVRIPDEPGLSLRTGNGAGLELEVDGKLGKPMSGTVRTVALDANRLSGGAARTE
jgi:cytoskeleton protein RodZ